MGLQQTKLYCDLNFSYSNGAFGAYFDAGLTTETLIFFNNLGFAVYHFINLSGTSVYTFFITSTFVFVYNNFPSHNNLLK